MRMMLRVSIPTERGNEAFKDMSLGKINEAVMKHIKPEAAYFGLVNGHRGGMYFFNLAEPSDIIGSIEPLFLGLNATIELTPMMSVDDLQKGFKSFAP